MKVVSQPSNRCKHVSFRECISLFPNFPTFNYPRTYCAKVEFFNGHSRGDMFIFTSFQQKLPISFECPFISCHSIWIYSFFMFFLRKNFSKHQTTPAPPPPNFSIFFLFSPLNFPGFFGWKFTPHKLYGRLHYQQVA